MTAFTTKATFVALSSLGCLSSLLAQDAPPAAAVKPTPPLVIQNEEAKKSPLVEGTIFFYNGDSIVGQITDWSEENVSIISPDLVTPAKFSTAKILNITLKDTRNPTTEVDPNQDETTLIINNRDNQLGLHGVIKGGFASIDDKHVTLTTDYAGEIKVLKKFVNRMEIDSKKGYLYIGPKNLEEWYSNNIEQSWRYNNKSLIGGDFPGNIAQDLEMPQEASISFDLSWKEDEYITFYLYSSDHEQSRPDSFYQLSIQRGKASLLKYSKGRQLSHLTSEKQKNRENQRINAHDIKLKDKELHAHYDIYMSTVKGEFHIYRNGVKLDSYNDSTPKASDFGTALHLVSSNKTPVRIKNLTLSKWSGHIPSDVDTDTFEKIKGEGERILLKNGDILLGKIGKVKDGTMQIETLYTPLQIPIVRMRSIDLTGGETKEEPLKYQQDIKCWFKDTGWIILKPISIKGNTLTAFHQALGENEFDLNVFKRIDLHIYDETANANRKSDGW